MLIPAEQKRFAEYEKAVIDQARQEKEYAERPLVKPSLGYLLDALEAEAMDSIKEAHGEIGLMLRCKEKFKKDQAIRDLTNYFIKLAQYQIEEDVADVTRWREWKKSCRV